MRKRKRNKSRRDDVTLAGGLESHYVQPWGAPPTIRAGRFKQKKIHIDQNNARATYKYALQV